MKKIYPVLAAAAAAVMAVQTLFVPVENSPIITTAPAVSQVQIAEETSSSLRILSLDEPATNVDFDYADALPSPETEQLSQALSEAFSPVNVQPESEVENEEQLSQEAEELFLSEEEAEKAFLAKNPELVALGEIVNEGDTLPRSQNDPSYHKYIRSLMRLQADSGSAPLTSMGVRLLTSAVSGASNLVHQDRFAGCTKVYGVDVSLFQGTVDWAKVKAAGITFAILRAGYRGYGSAGTLVVDSQFVTNLKNAKAAGLQVGAYFFTQAITTAEARAEADFVYSYAKGYSFDLPLYCDMEEISSEGRLEKQGFTAAQNTAIITAFCERAKELGYQAGVYSNPSWLNYKLDRATLESKYQIWLAHWVTSTTYSYEFNIWQYGTGTVNGISGAVDMNVMYISGNTPGRVSNLKCSTFTDTTASLSWTGLASNCTGYQIVKYDASDSTETVMGTTNLNTFTVTGLTGEQSYTFYVKAYNSVGSLTYYGVASEQVTVKTLCPAPTGLTIVEDVAGFTLSWETVASAKGYYIYIGKNGAAPALSAHSTGTSYFLEAEEGTYSGYVTPYTSTGVEGGRAEFILVYGKHTPEVSSIKHTDTEITLKWQPQTVASGYCVRLYSNDSGEADMTVALTDTTLVFDKLEPLTDYTLKIEACYADGTSLYSDPIRVRTSSPVTGDMDGDGVLNESDSTPILDYLTGGTDGEDLDPYVADINGDGYVDLLDYALLKMLLAGMEI
ncbi:MAG: fibronectin type III domain-containing protein [Ruminococcus sp.]|nr:fibronectin type III domain-containing protein [Ruminococcus sp.]